MPSSARSPHDPHDPRRVRDPFTAFFPLLPLRLRPIQRTRQLLTESAPEAVEVLNALALLAWGIWLALPLDSFGVVMAYRFLRVIAPEPLWAGLFLGVGTINVVGLLTDGLFTRRLCTFVSTCVWAGIAVASFFANPASLAGPIYLVLALTLGWAYLRLGGRHYAR